MQNRLRNDQAGHWASGLTEFSLRRRITVLVLLMSIAVVGVIATLGIPLEVFPRGYTGQFIGVWAPWPNAPTQEVLDEITLPLEEELSTLRGLDRINSWSSMRGANVWMQFKHGTDMDVAYREVRDRVQRARLRFPEDVDRVFINKEDTSGIPVAVIGVAIDPELADYYTLLQREIVQPLERIDGVAKVGTDGLEEKEILIEVDKELAESNGLDLWNLTRDLSGDNFTMASGHVRDAGRKFLLRSVATYRSIEEIENRPLTPTVRLKDVARVKYEEPEKRYSVRVNGRPAFAIVIFKEGEANTVDVSREIRRTFDEIKLNPRLATMMLEMFFLQGDVVVESLGNLAEGGLIGGSFAALILFVFLRRFRLTTIITFSIPLSMLIALIVMFFAGESLNILTILALVIGVGMLVDNSIVVAENIHRQHRDGLPRHQACVKGAGEIALAITMATLTTIVVFVPVALVEGQGQFFLVRLALPISVSLIASLLVALVFIPLAVYLTLPANGRRTGALIQWSHERISTVLTAFYDSTFEKLNRKYTSWLGFFLNRRLDLVLLLAVVFAATYFLAFQKVELVEQQDEDRTSFRISVDASQEYGLEEIGEYFAAAEKVLAEKQEEFGLEGYLALYHPHGGRFEGWLAKDRETDLSAKEIGEELMELLPKKPGIKLFFNRENRTEEAKGKEVFVFSLEGDDAGILDEVAENLEPAIERLDGVLAIRQQDEPAPNELGLVIDRERASAGEISPEVIAGIVGYALRGRSLPKFNYEGREIPVRIRFQEADRESLLELGDFQIPTPDGGSLPLSALTSTKMLKSPKGIFRTNKRTTRSITVELKKDQAKETRRTLMALQRSIDLPEGVSFGTRSVQTINQELANMMFAGGLSIIFIYLLMGFLFESFILPLSIIFTIPLAGIGVVWIHYVFGRDFDFLGLVGGVLLIGVVVNNAIVLVDYVIRLRSRGLKRQEALLQAAERRFRPIAMTALTTIIGMIPLTLRGPSDMGLSYKSFGLTLIGGMSTATLLTLLVVPVFYTLFDDARNAISATLQRLLATRKEPEPPVAGTSVG